MPTAAAAAAAVSNLTHDLFDTPVGDSDVITAGSASETSVKVMTRLVKHTGYCSPSDVSVAAMTEDMFCLVVPQKVVAKSALKTKLGKFRFELKIDKSRNMIT